MACVAKKVKKMIKDANKHKMKIDKMYAKLRMDNEPNFDGGIYMSDGCIIYPDGRIEIDQ